jgi:hypothetical protein
MISGSRWPIRSARQVELLRRRAAHVGVHAALGDDRVARLVHEVARHVRGRRALRDHSDEGRGAVLRHLRLAHRLRAVAGREALVQLRETGVVRALGAQVGRDQQRPVRPGAERVRHQVVGLAGRGGLGRARLVGEPELESLDRRGEREQQRDRDEREHARPAGEPAAPAPQERAVAERRALVASDAELLDAVAAQPEQGRQQGHRGEHGDHYDDGGGLAEHGDEGHAGHREREQRDDDRPAGERDGAPRRGSGVSDRVGHAHALLAGRARAGDDEQRVVDADAEADHRRHGRRDVRHGDDVAEQRDDAQPADQAEDRHGDRQRHRGDGPEHEDEDQHRGGDSDHPVAGHRRGALLVRVGDAGDVVGLRQLLQGRLDDLAVLVVGHLARFGVEGDRAGVRQVLGEGAGHDVVGGGAVGAGHLGAAAVLRAGGVAREAETDQHDEPDADDERLVAR